MKKNTIERNDEPVFLSREEVTNPISLITEFFGSEYDAVYVQKSLKKIFRSALNEKILLSKNEIIQSASFKEALLKLLETAWLVCAKSSQYQVCHVKSRSDVQSVFDVSLFYPDSADAARAWLYFPRHLSEQEMLNPFKPLQKVFKNKPLSSWRQSINCLFSAAISQCTIFECDENSDDWWQVGERLFKLMEGSYLLYIRFRC